MMEFECEVPPLKVIRVRSNGKRDFDPGDKRQLVEACLRPGVSVAGMALKVGINTNQLRKWIRLYQATTEAAAADSGEPALPAFVPVVEVGGAMRVPESPASLECLPARAPASPQTSPRPPLTALLTARLPNGVTVELECGGQDVALVKAMIEALGAR
ncbi:IS66-like element accessory protein TnpA [Cupriavidus basilensis]|uniref:IS66-like element accessory protein TnpA n=1 Tax=Cupriavidus basilensis TaxID=68895 RepID=UPI0039F71410